MTVVVLSFTSMYSVVSAESINDTKNERSKVQKNLSKKESEIKETIDEVTRLQKELNAKEEKIQQIQLEIDEKEEKVQTYYDEFQATMNEVSRLNELIKTRNEILKNRLASYQESGGSMSFIEVIFGATSFNDFISRINSIHTITSADQELIKQQEDDKVKVEKLQEELTEKIKDQESMIKEVEEKQQTVRDEKETIQKEASELKKKQVSLEKSLEKLEHKDKELAQKEKEYKKQLTTSTKKEKTSSNNKVEKGSNKPKNNTSTKGSGTGRLKVGETRTMEATAYGPDCKGCSGYTATGMKVLPYNGQKVIAVDPSVIPLGSVVKVEGYGIAVAADTGGAIKGNKIDVLFPSEKDPEVNEWGRKHVEVTLISTP